MRVTLSATALVRSFNYLSIHMCDEFVLYIQLKRVCVYCMKLHTHVWNIWAANKPYIARSFACMWCVRVCVCVFVWLRILVHCIRWEELIVEKIYRKMIVDAKRRESKGINWRNASSIIMLVFYIRRNIIVATTFFLLHSSRKHVHLMFFLKIQCQIIFMTWSWANFWQFISHWIFSSWMFDN